MKYKGYEIEITATGNYKINLKKVAKGTTTRIFKNIDTLKHFIDVYAEQIEDGTFITIKD